MVFFFFYRGRLRLKKLQALQNGQETVRKKIASSLHDSVASKISGIRLKLLAITNGSKDSKKQQEIADELGNLYEGIRRLSHRLSPITYQIQHQVFSKALSNLFSDFQRYRNINIDVQGLADVPLNTLKEPGKISLYSIFEELLHNIYKHAKSNNVHVTFSQKNNLLLFSVKDDGIGMPKEYNHGIGLYNIASHVTLLKGKWQIKEGLPGCLVEIQIPYRKNKTK